MINQKNNVIKVEIDLDAAGNRIDVFLKDLLSDFSRSRIQSLIENQEVSVNSKGIKSSYKVKEGDIVEVKVPEVKLLEINPENIPLDIVFEDEDLVVVNKPAGMLTHPAPGKYSGTLVNALLYHCGSSLSGINGILRPGIIHRLDKDTTGLIIIAKNDFTHQHLAQQLQERTIDKHYLAIIQGNLKEEEGIIDAPIARHPVKREKMCVIKDGKEAITTWKVLERFNVATFIEAKLLTGRTHQLRVHFSHIKHPILGDSTYSSTKAQKIKLERQLLQSYKLEFIHPRSNEKMPFEIDYDPEIKRVLKIFNSQLIIERTQE